tara:strand:+ start:122 stop:418 length:297 start_codon:yes stop_codon:yes gene_type:complete
MALWGNTDADADEPKNLSTGEFQGTAGKAIYGVDTTEQSVANAASGDARLYAPPHAGWVGINTYTDMHGNLRVKTETLVAMSSLTGDQNTDDTVFADS